MISEYVLVRQDGSRCPIEQSFAYIRDEDGEIEGVIRTFRDISQRKAVEAERQTLLRPAGGGACGGGRGEPRKGRVPGDVVARAADADGRYHGMGTAPEKRADGHRRASERRWPRSSAARAHRRSSSTTSSTSRVSCVASCASTSAAWISRRSSTKPLKPCSRRRRPRTSDCASMWHPTCRRCPGIQTGCARCSGICCRTRSSSHRQGAQSASSRGANGTASV